MFIENDLFVATIPDIITDIGITIYIHCRPMQDSFINKQAITSSDESNGKNIRHVVFVKKVETSELFVSAMIANISGSIISKLNPRESLTKKKTMAYPAYKLESSREIGVVFLFKASPKTGIAIKNGTNDVPYPPACSIFLYAKNITSPDRSAAKNLNTFIVNARVLKT